MYQLALNLSPEDMRAIGAMVYSELLRFGVTHVCEFHYLHHDKNGAYYADRSTMAEQLLIAAEDAGINLCLVPIFYQRSDFITPAKAEQRRFLHHNVDEYLSFCEDVRKKCTHYGASFAAGVHSLRAATSVDAIQILSLPGDYPLHLHIAEQIGEVDQCITTLGSRPVRWLMDHVDIGSRHVLVHATHLDSTELTDLAKSEALAVLCPSTEANLGDGQFPFKEYNRAGGRWAIGSDSQVSLNPCEELRWLDYQVRLQQRARNPLVNEPGQDSGSTLFDKVFAGGMQGFGQPQSQEHFPVGAVFHGVVLNAAAPLLQQAKAERRLATFIYAGDPSYILGTISRGSWAVRNGCHQNDEVIRHRWSKWCQARA